MGHFLQALKGEDVSSCMCMQTACSNPPSTVCPLEVHPYVMVLRSNRQGYREGKMYSVESVGACSGILISLPSPPYSWKLTLVEKRPKFIMYFPFCGIDTISITAFIGLLPIVAMNSGWMADPARSQLSHSFHQGHWFTISQWCFLQTGAGLSCALLCAAIVAEFHPVSPSPSHRV